MAEVSSRHPRMDQASLCTPAATRQLPHIYRWIILNNSQAYDDIFYAENGPLHPDRITAGASIIIDPPSEDLRDEQKSPLLFIHIKDGSAIGAQSILPMELLAIVSALQLATHRRTPTTNSQPQAEAPKAHQQLYCTYEPTTTLLERLHRHTQMDSSTPREKELHVSELIKRRLSQSCT